MKTLILIDGHSLAYRMHFALERTGMRTKSGMPTWAVFGFFNALFSLLAKVKPDAIAVSFDLSRITFRNELYPEYKAHRDAMPSEMRSQMDMVRRGIELLGIPIYEKENFEADDVIGTLSCQAAKEGWWVQILTGDQDSFQLVDDLNPNHPEDDNSGKIEVLIPARTPKEDMRVYDRAGVFAKWGIYPEQVTDFKGLKGDTSDNIPGIPGVGDKTAVKLLSEYQTLENLYAHIDELPANKLKEKLVTYKDQAFLSKQLATIIRDVPMEVNFEDCHLAIPDYKALLDFMAMCEFRSFMQQAPVLLAPFLQGQAELMVENERETTGNVEALEFSMVETDMPDAEERRQLLADAGNAANLSVEHTIVKTRAQLDELFTRLREKGVFALDIETTGLDVHTTTLAGIAISISDGFTLIRRPAKNLLNLPDYPQDFLTLSYTGGQDDAVENFYVPLDHPDLQIEFDETRVLELLRPLLESEEVAVLVHNAKFECNVFRQLGIAMNGLVFDTMIASYIDNPDRQHGLKNLSQEIFGCPMCEIKELIGTGKKMIRFSEVPLEEAAAYSVCDGYTTTRLARHFITRFDDGRETLFYEIEMPLARILADMEWNGVSLDVPYLKTLSEELDQRLNKLEKEICALAGCEFNLNSPKQVGDILFEKMGIKPLKKTKGKTGYSTDVKVLEQLAGEYEIVRQLLEYRQLFKLKSTYIDNLPELINEKTHRLHTNFNQTVAATGRLSSSGPNLQNIPIRTELGRLIRKAFVPETRRDWVLLSADYSQIELRLLAHFSEDPNLIEAFKNNEDIHTATAALVFGMEKDKVTKEQRYRAKTVNFGVVYGQSAFSLAQQLKIPQAEAAEFIKRYFARYSAVRNCIDRIKAEAHLTGKVATLCGRERNLSEGLSSPNRSIREFSERAAFNTPLQGSAADLMKVAMIRLHDKLRQRGLQTRMILQVHDELVLEVPLAELDEVKTLVQEAMELDQPLRVPLQVDMEIGPSWMEGDVDAPELQALEDAALI